MAIATKCTCGYSITGVCTSSVKECRQLRKENTQLPPSIEVEIEKRMLDLIPPELCFEGDQTYDLAASKRYEVENVIVAYAAKLHQANETIKVLTYDNNRLKEEVEGLTRWKEEAKEIINPIWEYADTLKVPLGASKTEAVIKHANEAKKLLHEVLVMNEAWGDLPGEFINKVNKFLYGE